MVTVNDTIQAGKTWLQARLEKGDHCPLCNQHAKMYKRRVNSGMARSLIHIYRTAGKGWVHVKIIGARSREEGKLAYFGLLEEQTGVGMHGGKAGYWRVTDKGEQFLLGKLKIPTYARVYNGKVFGFEGNPVGIKEALGADFDYNDLMSR